MTLSISSDALNVGSSLFEYSASKGAASANKAAGIFEADRLLKNAKARMAKGTREAGRLRYQGSIMESDAVAAMGGQGGVTDPVLLAKIRERSNYNSLAALFEASSESSDLTQQSINTRFAAKSGAAGQMMNAGATLFNANKELAGKTFGEYMKKKSRPSGWQSSPF